MTEARLSKALTSAWSLIAGEHNLERILEVIVHTAETVTNAERGSLALVESDGQLHYVFSTGPENEELKKVRVKIGVGISGSVAASGKPLRINDVRTDPRFFDQVDKTIAFQTRSMLCVPMMNQSRVIGTIQVLNKRQAEVFTDEDEAALLAFGHQAAVAIERQNLFRSLVEQSRRIQGIFEALTDGLMVVDAASAKPILYNKAVEQIFFPEGHQNFALTTYLGNVINTNRASGSADIVLFKPHGVVLSNRYVTLHDEEGKPREVIVSIRNVTEQRTAERRFSQFYALMLHLNRRLQTQLRKAKDPRRARVLQRRLRQLASNLVYLTDLRSGPLRIDKSMAEFADLYDRIRNRYALIMERHRIKFREVRTTAQGAMPILVDKLRFRHALSILFELGLRVLRHAGRPEFDLEIQHEENRVCIQARYSGAPLAEKLEPKSLDWNHQVDQIIAGKNDWLDLNLPFLEHIVRAHKGNVGLQNEGDLCTTIKIIVPTT